MSLGGDFTVFATRSHVGKVAEAVRALIAGDDELSEFFGGPDDIRVYRTSGLVPDRPVPFCVVRPRTEPRELQLNKEAEVLLPIAIGVAYDEDRDVLPDGAKTTEDLGNRIYKILVEDQLLEAVPPALTLGLVDFEPLDLIPVRENEEGTITTLFIDFVARYRYWIDAETGVKT